jgi:hypothetical protein
LPKRPLSMTASENWISGPSKRVTSVSWFTESSRINPAQHLSTGLHCTRSSIETHGPGFVPLKPFPGITTEDRECVMRLILLLSF